MAGMTEMQIIQYELRELAGSLDILSERLGSQGNMHVLELNALKEQNRVGPAMDKSEQEKMIIQLNLLLERAKVEKELENNNFLTKLDVLAQKNDMLLKINADLQEKVKNLESQLYEKSCVLNKDKES